MDEESTNSDYLGQQHTNQASSYVGVPCSSEHLLLIEDDPPLEPENYVAQQNITESLISKAKLRFVPLHRKFENGNEHTEYEHECTECIDAWTKLLQMGLSHTVRTFVTFVLGLLMAVTSLAELPVVKVAILMCAALVFAPYFATYFTWSRALFWTAIVLNGLAVYNSMFLSHQEQTEDLAILADHAAVFTVASAFWGFCMAADSPMRSNLKFKLITISIVMIEMMITVAVSYFRHRDEGIVTGVIVYGQLPMLVTFFVTLTSKRIADVYALNLQTNTNLMLDGER